MGPHEPYWRTNTSFSPPPQRWDFRFQHEGQQSFSSQEENRLYGSSMSSNSRESRNWLRGNYLPNHRHSVSDGVGVFFTSPSDLSPAQQWTPPIIQEISLDEYDHSSKRVLGPLSFSPNSEGVSARHDGRASISSNSDSSDYDQISKPQSSNHNFTNRRYFMSKPVHPLSIPTTNPAGIPDSDDPLQHRLSTTTSDLNYSNASSPTESDSVTRSNGHKCNICERYLFQRSPWSSDLPVTGVLSCRHVFHAECLDQTTPKTHKNDPLCPVCAKSESKSSPDPRVLVKLKSGAPRVRPDGASSRAWGCGQGGSCVEGNAMVLLNRNRMKKGLSNSSNKELGGKLKKSGWQSGGGDGSGSSSRKKS